MLDFKTGTEIRPDNKGNSITLNPDNIKYIYHCASGQSDTNICAYLKPDYHFFEAPGENPSRYIEIINKFQRDPEKQMVDLNPVLYTYSQKIGRLCIKRGFLRKLVRLTLGKRYTLGFSGSLLLSVPRWTNTIKVSVTQLLEALKRKDDIEVIQVGNYSVTLQNIRFIYSTLDSIKIGILDPFDIQVLILTSGFLSETEEFVQNINNLFIYDEDCLIPVECKTDASGYFTTWFSPRYLKQITGRHKKDPDKEGYIKADIPSPGNWRVKLPDKIFK